MKSVEALTVAAIRETVPIIEQVPACCDEIFSAIGCWMKANGLSFGPPMTIYYADDFHKKVNGLTLAYNAVGQWIENNGYQIVGL